MSRVKRPTPTIPPTIPPTRALGFIPSEPEGVMAPEGPGKVLEVGVGMLLLLLLPSLAARGARTEVDNVVAVEWFPTPCWE